MRTETAIEESFTQSFAMQFISLMLFILIFTVASFITRIEPKTVSNASLVPSESISFFTPAKAEKIILHETLDSSFFSSDGSEIIPARWKALFSLLYQHDVSLVLLLPTTKGISGAVRTGPVLIQQFLRAGIPASAVRIELNPDSTATEAQAKIIEGELSW